MHAIIEPTAAHLHCHLSDAPDSLQLDRADALARLQAWGERCAKAVEANDDAALLSIGRELHDWLDNPHRRFRHARGRRGFATRLRQGHRCRRRLGGDRHAIGHHRARAFRSGAALLRRR